MSRILIVEDEHGLSGAIKEWLEEELYVVTVISDGKAALETILEKPFELLILDWMLPGLDGISICKRFREAGGKTPILILTAKSTMAAKEEGLDSGADDYLTKPFNMRELSARVRALLRRPQTTPKTTIECGDLRLDLNTRTVIKGTTVLKLLPKEFILLEVLMRHKGIVLSTEEIIDHVWGPDSSIAPDTVRSHVKALRKKIDSPGETSLIVNIHAMGYRIEEPNAHV
ncbi:response regulator transcription factor [Candidatus Obscuribacterales bacterium]|nr:response regulator transcription factor [Candidatus Obscuribacterales bacterium]